ncbi:hypothetical protein K450DRAFT_212480 [Umbelopsis ramanniana AG]|uniref:Alpha-mannosidase n=1 Tax=Umbelopsis ramanniana AG TaxID=1314678 RepID=A0AAD5E579_UMBRA|nr:uncharacterized protein K450DRAFT_212480 [Umbelopsis ramanniana AG]KAI8577611.1 hypothetical protein K450DRAFT_212480 [Umbelopsis ramanniana AG]
MSNQPSNTPKVPRGITLSRIQNFIFNGQFESMGLSSQLWKHRRGGDPTVTVAVYSVPELKRISFKDAISHVFHPTTPGKENFGPSWSTHWFRIHVIIPEEMEGERVFFQWKLGCEGMVWSKEGVPLQGLSEQERFEYLISDKAKAGMNYEFYIEAACNGISGVGGGNMVPDPNRFYSIAVADLVVRNQAAFDLYYDMIIIKGIATDGHQESQRARDALYVANEVINTYVVGSVDSMLECRKLTTQFLKQKNGTGQHMVTAVGNCHIDTAWLWPYDETKRKVARSWSSQLALMNRYSTYIFTASQAQQYEWLMEYYPALFEQIRHKVAFGQWELIGGSWVEHDTNMPSGEALGRQMLLGQRFYEKHFKKRVNVFWLPDSFGYSGQLPQVLKQSGIKYFFTQKLSWNNINKFPHTTFWWTGIDGSSVLAHLPPADTYVGQVNTSELYNCVSNHKDIDLSNESLLAFGHGDGGGGPTYGMLERLMRLSDVSDLPKCKPGRVKDFFERIDANAKPLNAYKGELYFELHRGTYTTQALVKKGNRKGELLLRDLEFLAAIADHKIQDYVYPALEIENMWKLVCLNQFHDCLPGSAIEIAYDDVHKFHRQVAANSILLRHKAQTALLGNDSEESDGKELVIFNTLAWDRSGIVQIPRKGNEDLIGQAKPDAEVGYVAVTSSRSMGTTVIKHLTTTEHTVQVHSLSSGHTVLENSYLVVQFDDEGRLCRLYDKEEHRELVPKSACGNQFQLYEDVPGYWDAWDVEIYHLQKGKNINGGSLKVSETGPLVASVTVEKRISQNSWIKQNISLSAISRRVEFDTEVEWRESHQFLKVEFNWDIVSDHATYEIQYGAVQRPNHYNTTLDSARFEVCGHKFADLSDAGYGVALLNDCKYGYATHGQSQRLSLLRSPKGPDAHADMGRHYFKYAVYPHKGYFHASDVVQQAYEFNVQLLPRFVSAGRLEDQSYFTLTGSKNVILDWVKKAEDSSALIVRLYEAYGGRSSVTLKTDIPVKKVQHSNFLEDDTKEYLSIIRGGIDLTLNAFEVVTLKLEL